MTRSTGNTHQLLANWQRLSVLPGGAWLFSRMLSWWVPYSGSIKAQVKTLSPGHCQLKLKDRRDIRNHLNSIHAVALVNFGELTSGLAVVTSLPISVRGIVTKISTEYFAKARGDLTAECLCEVPAVNKDIEYSVQTDIRDSNNSLVARVAVNWQLGIAPDD